MHTAASIACIYVSVYVCNCIDQCQAITSEYYINCHIFTKKMACTKNYCELSPLKETILGGLEFFEDSAHQETLILKVLEIWKQQTDDSI